MSQLEFEDDNLKLAIIDALIQKGLVSKFDKNAWRAAHPAKADPDFDGAIDWSGCDRAYGDRTDEEEDGDEASEDFRDYYGSREIRAELAGLSVDEELTSTIEELYWGTHCDIIGTIWTYWDGESNEFDVQSLSGVEQLRNLKRLRIELCDVEDLAPLAGLPLESLVLRGAKRLSRESVALIEELRGRGVQVDIA